VGGLTRQGRRLRADAERNRAALATAAREVFAEQGLAAPLEHVAKRAGVGIATLYRNFPTRAALLDAVLADTIAAHQEIVQRALAAEDPWTGLTGYLTETCQLASTADRSAGQTMAIGRIIEVTEPFDRGAWRRQLALALDGLRPAAAHPLPHPPCEEFGAQECGVDL
jgi:AcrR family transcriptional regulator